MQNRAQLETRLETARALAKAYFEVVAEGVDTARRHDFLRAKGCDFAQGVLVQPIGLTRALRAIARSISVGAR